MEAVSCSFLNFFASLLFSSYYKKESSLFKFVLSLIGMGGGGFGGMDNMGNMGGFGGRMAGNSVQKFTSMVIFGHPGKK